MSDQQNQEKRRHTHALTPNDIGEPTEEKLADKITNWCSDLNAERLVCVQVVIMAIDIAQHLRCDVDGKDIVPINAFP